MFYASAQALNDLLLFSARRICSNWTDDMPRGSVKLILMRHAATEWNELGLYQGRKDLPLSDAGQQWAEERALPANLGAPRIWASPLLRARQTAALMFPDLNAESLSISETLTEINFGNWEGHSILETKQKLKSQAPRFGKWGWDDRPPEGESFRDVWNRIKPFLKTLNSDSLLITHRGVILTLMAKALDWDIESKCPIKIDTSQLQILEFEQHSETLELVRFNLSFLKKRKETIA